MADGFAVGGGDDAAGGNKIIGGNRNLLQKAFENDAAPITANAADVLDIFSAQRGKIRQDVRTCTQ